MTRQATAITLLSGFLGAGKTTLLNHLLAGDHGERIAVMVNDFGDVSIDAELIVGQDERSVTLANGCICCTLRDDLFESVQALLKREPVVERIVVEMSGIAEPRSVLNSFAAMERGWPLHLDGVVAVVDAEGYPRHDDPHYLLAREQLALADLVVLNKLDLVSEAQRDELRRRLARDAPEARLVEAHFGQVPLAIVLGTGAALARSAAPAEPVDHGDFRTITFRRDEPLSLEAVRSWSQNLPAQVYRVKGILHLQSLPEHQVALQIVGRRCRVDRGRPWSDGEAKTSTIVLVYSGQELDAEQLLRSLKQSPSAGTAGKLAQALEWLREKVGRP